MDNAVITIAIVLGIILAFFALVSWILEIVWNVVMVGVFHLPALGFWTAFCLLVLVGIVAGAFNNSK